MIEKNSIITMKKLINLLNENNNFIIIHHDYPDADTIGSSVALCSLMRLLGKTAYIYENSNIDNKYKKYLNKYNIKNNIIKLKSYFFITCDVADINLISNFINDKEFDCKKINLSIDHHLNNKLYAKKNYIDFKKAACGEIIYKIIKKMNITINKDIVNGIYMAICGDTGHFKFNNTSELTHKIAAWCIKNKANKTEIDFELFNSINLRTFKCLEWIIKHTKFYYENKISVLILNESFIYSKFNIYINDLNNLIYLSQNIINVELVLIFKIYKDSNNIKLSIRSTGKVSAFKLSKYFGGGGHEKAAGTTFIKSSTSIEKLIDKIVDIIKFDTKGVFQSC